MKHIIFKPNNNVPGYIKIMGTYLGYHIGRIEEEYYDSRVDFVNLDAVVISEDIAPGYKFADIYKDYVSMRQNATVIEDFPWLQSDEDPDLKVRYTLTDADKALGVEYNKFILRKIVEDRFTQRLRELQVNASELEEATWTQQVKEAEGYLANNNYSTTVLDRLIEDTEYTKAEYANKVLQRQAEYFVKLAQMLKEQRGIERKIKLCETIADCHRLRHEKFGFSVSYQQQVDENISNTPLTLKMDF